MRAPKILERDVLSACMDWLDKKRVFHWRANTGAMLKPYKGKEHFIRFGIQGVPDIIAVNPHASGHFVMVGQFAQREVVGQFVGIECKRPGKEQSQAQKNFETNLIAAGGRYLLVHSVEELIEKW